MGGSPVQQPRQRNVDTRHAVLLRNVRRAHHNLIGIGSRVVLASSDLIGF